MRPTNINSLGTVYNVVDGDGDLLRAIKIIRHDEILKKTIGEYDELIHGSFEDYTEAAKERLSGFVKTPLSIYWYRTTEDDFQLMNIIDTCVEQNYDCAIVDIQ